MIQTLQQKCSLLSKHTIYIHLSKKVIKTIGIIRIKRNLILISDKDDILFRDIFKGIFYHNGFKLVIKNCVKLRKHTIYIEKSNIKYIKGRKYYELCKTWLWLHLDSFTLFFSEKQFIKLVENFVKHNFSITINYNLNIFLAYVFW